MRSNPFNTDSYENVWLKHYGGGQKAQKFKFLNGVKFIKGKLSGQFTNIGGNYTSGLFYEINKNEFDYKNKSFFIYDVPQYLDSSQIENGDLKVIKLRQYKGFYVDIQQYKTMDEVLLKCFNSSKSRYNFKRTMKQFNEQHTVSCKMFLGQIDSDEYEELMDQFETMMKARFEGLEEENTLLPMWDFYKDLLFLLINEKKVGLFVVYSDNAPAAMSINFLYDDNLVVATRTFDIDYFKLGIGNTEIYYLIEWCIENEINILDFSKGERDYKKRWCDNEYYFERHIIYDSSSIKAKTTAKAVVGFHNFKQYLRDKKINLLVHKLKDVVSFNK